LHPHVAREHGGFIISGFFYPTSEPKGGGGMAEKVDISVNICTYNRSEWLRSTLDSVLRQQTGGTFAYEVVIIDDGSTDATPALVQKMTNHSNIPIRYFREERVGVAAARNRGVRESKGEWIAFIDDDETAEPDWLQELMAAARAQHADCVGGSLSLVFPQESAEIPRGTSRKLLSETTYTGWFQKRFDPPLPGTCNALVKRQLFQQIGSFDSRYSHSVEKSGPAMRSLPQKRGLFDTSIKVVGEDSEFFRRARKAGFKIAFTPRSLVNHHILAYRMEQGYLIGRAKSGGTSLAYFDWKYWSHSRALIICALRIIHAMFITGPNLLSAYVHHDKQELLSRKCSLYIANFYVLKMAALVFRTLFSHPPVRTR
jgi:succinoglycan biosynthesis protein ExoM